MSFGNLLNQRCAIRRAASAGRDSHGHPVETWSDAATDVPCRLQSSGGKELVRGDVKVISEATLLLAASADITEKDRIVLEAITYDVLLVETVGGGGAIHHKRAHLQAVR